jgi:hypothetical protein
MDLYKDDIINKNECVKINNIDYKLYIIDNVETYKLDDPFNHWEIKKSDDTHSINNNHNTPINHYFIFETHANEAFGHWVFESAIYIPLFKALKARIPSIKIHLKKIKKFKKLFIEYFGLSIDTDTDTQLKNPNICYFINPISCMCDKDITLEYINQLDYFYNIFNFNYDKTVRICCMPRQFNENYTERTYDMKNIIDNLTQRDILLNTDSIEELSTQIRILNSSSVIIVTDGSPITVNGMFCNNSVVIIIGNQTLWQRSVFKKAEYIISKHSNNNKVFYLNKSEYKMSDINELING